MNSKIIIIDDDPVSSKIAEISIRRNQPNIEVMVYNNPLEALENIIHLHRSAASSSLLSHTLLLIDLNMPEMTGWEFIESLNECIPEMEAKVKGIILSSSVDPADIEKSKEYPRIVQYFTKPFTLEMANSLDRWLA